MTSWFAKLRARFGGSSPTERLPEGHLPVDWSKWSPAGEGDVRSPCPAINALANHGILPHSGRNITKAMAVEALERAFNVDPQVGSVFAAAGVAANPNHAAHSFDLNHVDKHGFIEHDCSLSRDDIAFGSNTKFNPEIFSHVVDAYVKSAGTAADADSVMTSWKTAGEARYARVLASKAKHEQTGKPWLYGIREAIMSYGETSLYLNLLGKDGVAPLHWVRIFFEEERLPYAEGWRPPPKLNQSMLNHGYFEMIKSSEHGSEEAVLIGLGTFEALKNSILNLGASLLKSTAPKQ